MLKMRSLLYSVLLLLSFSIQADEPVISTSDVTVQAVKLPGTGEAVIAVPNHWKMYVSPPDEYSVVSVKFISTSKAEPMSFIMSFIPNRIGKHFSKEENANLVRKLAQPHVASSVEGQINLKSLDATFGTAIYASFNDRKYQNSATIPEGEFSSITVGQIPHSKIVLAFTILTNGTESKELAIAKIILGSLVLHGKA